MQKHFDSKRKTNITIAFIGPYLWFPELKYNGSLVVSGYDRINITKMSDMKLWGLKSWWYWNQKGAELAIENVNANSEILPNTTIMIKKFNGYCEDYTHCGGLAMATAMEIHENHPDVVAVFGDFFGTTTKYSAAVYSYLQLPFCGSSMIVPNLLNKSWYPYFTQTITATGYGESLFQLLKFWNVGRIAVLSSKRNPCPDIVSTLSSRGIQIIAILRSVTDEDAVYIADTLERVDARYILYCGSTADMGTTYLTLAATLKRLVGPNYVWITQNGLDTSACKPSGNCTQDYGENYRQLFQGIIQPNGQNLNSPKMTQLQKEFTRQVNQFQEPWGKSFDFYTIASWFNMLTSYDCTGMLAHGLHKLLHDNPDFSEDMLANGELQSHLNHTAFTNTGFSGLTGDPLVLNPGGDAAAAFIFAYYLGDEEENYVFFGLTDIDHNSFQYADTSMDIFLTPLVDNKMVFFGGSSIPPIDGAVYSIDAIHYLSQKGVILMFLAGLGILASLLLFALVRAHCHNPMVKAGSVTFLSILSITALPSYASIALFLNEESVSKCKTRIWLQLLSYSMMMGCVIVKNLRVWIIYTSKTRISKKKLKENIALLFWAGLVIVELSFLSAYMKTSHIEVKRSLPFNRLIQSQCVNVNSRKISEHALSSYNLALLIILFYTTYVTRNVGFEHSEQTLLMVLSLYIPVSITIVAIISKDETSSSQRNFAMGIVIWTTVSIPVLFNLIPIIIQTRSQKLRLRNLNLSISPSRSAKSLVESKSKSRTCQISRNLSFTSVRCCLSKHNSLPLWEKGILHIGSIHSRKIMLFIPVDEDGIEPGITAVVICGEEHGEIQKLGDSPNQTIFRIKIKSSGGFILADFHTLDQAELALSALQHSPK